MCRLVESPHLSLQLRIWISAAAQSDIRMKYAVFCVESRPVLRFTKRAILIASRTKACKTRVFLPVLHSDTMNYGPSKVRNPEVNLRVKSHFSRIDKFVVPPIFSYLIGAKDVEIWLVRTFDWHDDSRKDEIMWFGHRAVGKTSTFFSWLKPKKSVYFPARWCLFDGKSARWLDPYWKDPHDCQWPLSKLDNASPEIAGAIEN